MDDSLLGMFVMIGRQRGSFVSMSLREAIFLWLTTCLVSKRKGKLSRFLSPLQEKIVTLQRITWRQFALPEHSHASSARERASECPECNIYNSFEIGISDYNEQGKRATLYVDDVSISDQPMKD